MRAGHVCPKGYWHDGEQCGYTACWSSCVDVNECVVDGHACGSGGTCVNQPGSYTCACLPGYRLTVLDGRATCEDIDECREIPTACAKGHCCANSPGSYQCYGGETPLALGEQGMAVLAIAFTSDGRRVAAGSHDGSVHVWDTWTGMPAMSMTKHSSPVAALAFAPAGDLLATAGQDRVMLWDVGAAGGKPRRTLAGQGGTVSSVAFSADGSMLAGAGEDGIRVWDVASGALLRTMAGSGPGVLSVAFEPKGTWLAAASRDHTVRLWDAAEGSHVRTLYGLSGNALSVAFDGQRVAAGAGDGSVGVWDASIGERLLYLTGHAKLVNSVSLSADGSRLMTVSASDRVVMWDAKTGDRLGTVGPRPKKTLTTAVLSPSGTHLASGSVEAAVELWCVASLPPGGKP